MHHHKTSGATIYYNHLGLHITVFGSKLLIAWSDIEHCSITPALDKIQGKWKTYDKEPLEQLQYIELKFVLKDRQLILKKAKFFMKLFLILGLNLKPLLAADDTFTKAKGVITLEADTNALSSEYHIVVDILEKHTKFKPLFSF